MGESICIKSLVFFLIGAFVLLRAPCACFALAEMPEPQSDANSAHRCCSERQDEQTLPGDADPSEHDRPNSCCGECLSMVHPVNEQLLAVAGSSFTPDERLDPSRLYFYVLSPAAAAPAATPFAVSAITSSNIRAQRHTDLSMLCRMLI